MMKSTQTTQAPAPSGAYSQAIKASGMLFIAGQIPLNPKTGEIGAEDFKGQAELVLAHLGAILKAEGLDYRHVVKTEVFLKDINDAQIFNAVYATYFTQDPKPARWVVEVSRLPKDVKVEVSCTAVFS